MAKTAKKKSMSAAHRKALSEAAKRRYAKPGAKKRGPKKGSKRGRKAQVEASEVNTAAVVSPIVAAILSSEIEDTAKVKVLQSLVNL